MRLNKAACDMIGAASKTANQMSEKKNTVIAGVISHMPGDWTHLSLQTMKPRGAKKDYEVTVLSTEEILPKMLLVPQYGPILGVVSVIDSHAAAGDWSNHHGPRPTAYKLKVRSVDLFTAAKLNPERFKREADELKRKMELEEKQKAEEDAKKSKYRKKRR